ncbi:MAG: hypothetical protein QNJ29_14685 [Rhizobiaceae bacterium]|nr:hypothetical protein [Rhizobiaceae bacterium]
MAFVKGSIEGKGGNAESANVIPAVGSKRLHRPRVTRADLLASHTKRKTKSLISLLLGHSMRLERLSAPRSQVKLRALTPSGKPAVKIRLG